MSGVEFLKALYTQITNGSVLKIKREYETKKSVTKRQHVGTACVL